MAVDISNFGDLQVYLQPLNQSYITLKTCIKLIDLLGSPKPICYLVLYNFYIICKLQLR